MDEADIPVVFYDKETFQHKKMPLLDADFVKDSFQNEHLNIFTDRQALEKFLLEQNWKNKNLLLMSSGNFAGMNVDEIAGKILN
jgi:UDP-N-acetylmuramate: L-alanyl-gamma-D-glutamyl-meso-diaminopimelate ligase